MKGVEFLRQNGWPEDVCRAILGHATYSGVPRDTPMARTLFAVDELSGLVVACALVTLTKSLDEVEVSSVKKKMKRADFARNVNREDILTGAVRAGRSTWTSTSPPPSRRCAGSRPSWVSSTASVTPNTALAASCGSY